MHKYSFSKYLVNYRLSMVYKFQNINYRKLIDGICVNDLKRI